MILIVLACLTLTCVNSQFVFPDQLEPTGPVAYSAQSNQRPPFPTLDFSNVAAAGQNFQPTINFGRGQIATTETTPLITMTAEEKYWTNHVSQFYLFLYAEATVNLIVCHLLHVCSLFIGLINLY